MATHITRFSTHSAYSTYINGNNVLLPNVSYCDSDGNIHYNELKLITFAIDNVQYQAVEGMTFGDWVNSSYNTNNEFELRPDLDLYVIVKTTNNAQRVCLNNYTDIHSTDKILSYSYLFRNVMPEPD